jgi:hypothetical protein
VRRRRQNRLGRLHHARRGHLAGALGKPVWILLRFDACWRWLLHGDSTPWYPSARLYRQPTFGDWDGVIDRVSRDLAQFVPATITE